MEDSQNISTQALLLGDRPMVKIGAVKTGFTPKSQYSTSADASRSGRLTFLKI